MSDDTPRPLRAGDTVSDACRVCKTDRTHRVIVADQSGRALRVICESCGSQHNYRGGEAAEPAARVKRPDRPEEHPGDPVTQPERRSPMSDVNEEDALDRKLRRIIREEIGLSPVRIAEKWRGG